MKKILIVDDEPHIRRLLKETLEEFEDYGVEIFTASNGVEAVDAIIREKPDLVYLDIMMPEMNGYDVCKKIKNEKDLESVKIVLLTAKGQMFDRQKGLDSGGDMYITKPFDPDFIVNNTAEILGIKLDE